MGHIRDKEDWVNWELWGSFQKYVQLVVFSHYLIKNRSKLFLKKEGKLQVKLLEFKKL